jgi:hypothetical protein
VGVGVLDVTSAVSVAVTGVEDAALPERRWPDDRD